MSAIRRFARALDDSPVIQICILAFAGIVAIGWSWFGRALGWW